ncbi:MAG: FAD-binding protein [Flavobacteriaceae bacterium]|nr:FAD-binding protein [Flavobacteriaceae bacterium]
MQKALLHLKESLEGELYLDHLHKMMYATDASVYRKIPLAVAYPNSEDDIIRLIKFAKENNTSIVPRTAGTSLAGQCVGEGIIVDVSKHFTQILELNVEAKVVKVQPGVIRDELNAYLEPHGLFFGPNTSTSNRCMIGGMVGNNSSGTTSIKYGVTRDKVTHIRGILSNGDVLVSSEISKSEFEAKTKQKNLEGVIYQCLKDELTSEEAQQEIEQNFPKKEIHRRNTGYAVDSLLNSEVFGGAKKGFNLSPLLCGSEGTLLFSTEITLKLDDLPPSNTVLVVAQYKDLHQCLNDVGVAMKHDLYTCEMMDDIILDCTKGNLKYEPYRFFVEGNPRAILMLELKSDDQLDLQEQAARLIADLESSGNSYARPILKGEDIDKAMELRKAGLGLLGNMIGDSKAVACIEDTAVALEDLPNYIREFSAIMEKYEQRAVYYAHAGAGELHLRPILNLKTNEGVDYFRKITTEVAALCKKYGGSFSGEHGDGIVRAEFLRQQIGDRNFQLLQRIKKAFDPDNLLNPGKITDAWPMDESLRNEVDKGTPKIETLLNFDDSEGIVRLAEKCNGSGDCRKSAASGGTMCPSYQATKDEKDSTRARANVLREVLNHRENGNPFNSEELKSAMDLCLSCKACSSECPSTVDIAAAKAEYLFQYYQSNKRSRADNFFGKSSHYHKKAASFPKLTNFLFQLPGINNLIKNFSGVAQKRTLPKYSTRSFSKHYQSIDKQENKEIDVILFVDEFCNYLESNLAWDALNLLHGLNYKVEVVHHLDSARALLSKGFLEEAKLQVDENIDFLKDKVNRNTPLVGIEPSAILGFRDEYIRLASDVATAKQISENTVLMEEFLASEAKKGSITSDQFVKDTKSVRIHNHCHQKALSNQKHTFDVLNIPKNYSPTLLNTGCCGMAGSFGYEKEHYDVSMNIGELRLFPALRKTEEEIIIAANGFSCREQIKDGVGKQAQHPITILVNALAD